MSEKKLRILLMAKDDQLRSLIESIINKNGDQCVGVSNPESLLKSLEDKAFHIVIADLDTDRENMDSLVSSIKYIKPDACLMAVTSDLTSENAVNLIRAGVDNIISKPIQPKEIVFSIAFSMEKYLFQIRNEKRIEKMEESLRTYKIEVDNSQVVQEQNFIDTVKTFIGLLEYRDQNLGSHCKRVATFTRAISEQYDLKDRIKKEIEIGALLHDIGKIGLPDQILLKTRDFFSRSQMTNKELGIYKRHSVIGQEAIQMINTMSNVGVYVKHHHERFNGSGYPDGIKGYLIPLGARIIHVVDAYDRIVFGVDKQKQKDAEILFLKFLQKNKGEVFDPEAADNVVEFIKTIKSKEYSAEKRINIESLVPGMILARDVYSKSGVLLISQYERISSNDVERLNRFLNSEMIIDNIYIYESSSAPGIKTAKKTSINDLEISVTNSDKDNRPITEIIESVKELETIRSLRDSINNHILDAKSTRDDMSNIIKGDPVISLKLLRIANSQIFGFSSEVETIEEAVSILGYSEVRRIVASVPVRNDSEENQAFFNLKNFRKHMLGCAVTSRIIGRAIGAKNVELYFAAGLLHDIGKLVFYQYARDIFLKVIYTAAKESIFYRKAERNAFGQTHDETGSHLLNKWKIPSIIVDAVKNHHSPMDSAIDPVLASAVHFSDIVAHMLHIGESGEKAVPRVENFAERKLGITIANLESFIPEIDEDLKYFENNLFID